MLEVRSVSHSVGNKKILQSVSFELEEGRFLAIVGPSGSGKTSLLRGIAGLERPQEGRVSWRSVAITDQGRIIVPPERRRIGLVFQDSALFPHLTVENNVGFGVADDRRATVERWLDRLGVRAIARRSVQSLSAGERQRVALARSLAARPELLLLDEPFSNVDRLHRRDLIHTLAEILQESKMTAIIVTHDIRDAIDLGIDSLVILDGGVVKQVGRLRDVLDKPGDPWVERFLACGLGEAGSR